MKIFNNVSTILFISLFIVFFSSLSSHSFAYANESESESKTVTIEDELNFLKGKLIDIEKSIAELSLDIHTVKENLSLYVLKKDKDFDITYLEILLNDVSKFKHIYNQSDNEYLERSISGKKVTKLFWASLKKGNARISIRCFYRMKADKSRKEFKIVKDFTFPSRKKVSNFLSVALKSSGTGSFELNNSNIDIDIKFW